MKKVIFGTLGGILYFCLIVVIGIFFTVQFYESIGYVHKFRIRECFDEVNEKYQVFHCNGVRTTDKEGNFSFYPTKRIDEAIECLNEAFK